MYCLNILGNCEKKQIVFDNFSVIRSDQKCVTMGVVGCCS